MAKYPQIGSMIQKKDRDTEAPILDKNGKPTYYIKVDKNTEVTVKNTVNGKTTTAVVSGGGYINISRPRDKFDRMLEKGTITAKEHAEKIARFEKGGDLDYIQFEVSATVEE